MKKVLLNILLGCVILCITACSDNSGKSTAGNSVNDNTTTESQGNSPNSVTDNTSNSVQESTSNEPQFVKVNKNLNLNISNGEDEIVYRLNDVCFMSEVHSMSDNMFASYFPDISGEVYVVAKISIKNVGGNIVGSHFFDDIEITFDDKYNYSMQQLDLESSVMSKYWSCQPLKTTEIYWVQSVPDEVTSMGCNITFKVGDTLYKY